MKIFILIFLVAFTFSFDFSSKEFQDVYQETKLMQSKLDFTPPKFSFNCPKIPPSNPPPTNARKLRPSDIKVVMAIGDSITAGFAMNDDSYVTSIFEYRGRVGSMGIDTNFTTLPNFLSQVKGEKVKGASVGRGLPLSARPWNIRPNNPDIDHLNGAQSNSRISHLKAQIDYVVRQGQREPGVDWKNDWKMLTILIGANNLCDCKLEHSTPQVFERTIRDLLIQISREIPKVYVSFVPIFESGFSHVWRNGESSTYCKLMWNIFRCPCLIESEETRRRSVILAKQYNQIIYKLAKEYNDQGKEDLFVAIQPVLQDLEIEDLTFTSKFDCFHPSLKANSLISVLLWNSIQLPPERKPRRLTNPLVPLCPNESTLIQ